MGDTTRGLCTFRSSLDIMQKILTNASGNFVVLLIHYPSHGKLKFTNIGKL